MNESTLLSIKQFSSVTGLNLSTLRYYDEIGILPPVSRGENNYRYYSPQQIIVANFIGVLVELGVPLSVIKNLQQNRTPETLIELLGHQEDRLDYLLHEIRTASSIIHIFRKNILNGMMVEDGLIRAEQLSDTNFELGPVNAFSDSDETFYDPFIKFCKSASEHKINLKYPVGGYHENMEKCLKATGKPDRFISQDPLGSHVRPAGKYLVGYTRGYYGEIGDLASRMAEYAQEEGLYFHGPVYTTYLLDEISLTDPHQYLSSLSVRVSNRKTDTLFRRGAKKEQQSTKLLLQRIKRG